MKKKKFLLFDLDGTLIEPMEGITKSVKYALNYFNIKVTNLEELTKFIGPPLKDSFMNFYGFSENDASIAVQKYRERFKEKGIFENYIYDGIEELLISLKQNNMNLFVATSKPEIFARQIIKQLSLDKYFDFIGGATLDEIRNDKADVIEYIMNENNITQKEDVVMIGDRMYDVIGAKKNNIASIGVLYGHGSFNELSEAKADCIVSDINELKMVFMD